MRTVFWLIALCFSIPAMAAGTARPNIVIFILDDVGHTDIGAFGNPVARTPHIDRLAAQGMRFTQAFLTTSSCSPSRASILTGLYPHSTGAPALHDPVPASLASLPKALRESGYYTASVGKWHLGDPFKAHFHRVVENREESGAADWLPELARRPANQPFFFWFASADAHTPYDWQPPLAMRSPDSMPIHPWSQDSSYERQMLAQYHFEITRADYHIGQVVAQLDREGILDNTVIITLSDNGTQFGGAKTTLYDEGLKTPLVIRYPPLIAAGLTNHQLVSSVDIAPTLLTLTQTQWPAGLQGVSLLPTLQDPSQRVREFVIAERNAHAQPFFERAIRTEKLLYKRNYLGRKLCDQEADLIFGKKRRDSAKAELYDLQADPLARHNVIQDPAYQQSLDQLRQLLNEWMHATGDIAPPRILEQCTPRPWHERIQIPDGWTP